MYNGSLHVLAEAELGAGNVARARLLGEEALARSERPECANAGAVTNSLIALGGVMLTSNDPQAANARLTRLGDVSGITLVNRFSQSNLRRGAGFAGAETVGERAELCGFLLSWAISTYTVKQQAGKVVQELEAQLSPEVLWRPSPAAGRVRLMMCRGASGGIGECALP